MMMTIMVMVMMMVMMVMVMVMVMMMVMWYLMMMSCERGHARRDLVVVRLVRGRSWLWCWVDVRSWRPVLVQDLQRVFEATSAARGGRFAGEVERGWGERRVAP